VTSSIRTTVPKLPKGMGDKKKGCELCGQGGALKAVPRLQLDDTTPRLMWVCKRGCTK